jgi:hypothetical protein
MIEARHLSKRYGSRLAVDDLSFTVPPGKVIGFLGPNAAGKTIPENDICLPGYPVARPAATISAGGLSATAIGSARQGRR